MDEPHKIRSIERYLINNIDAFEFDTMNNIIDAVNLFLKKIDKAL